MRCLRLKKKKEFSGVLKAGKRVHSHSLTVVYLKQKQLKVAVCVGKKYGKSVQRNHLKRLLREAFRPYAEKMTVPCSVLLIPKVAETYSFFTFHRDLGKLLSKERLLEN